MGLNIAGINTCDVANGVGIRVSLFVSGCNFHCPGCFNQKAQRFDYGTPYSDDIQNLIMKYIEDENYSGLSLLGGDPLWQDEDGLQILIDLCKQVKRLNKSIWIWSGFKWNDLIVDNSLLGKLRLELISNCDVFIDDRFEQSNKTIKLPWKGSSNQHVIDVTNTILNNNKIVLYNQNIS